MGPLGSWIDELKAWVDGFEPGTLDGEQAVALVAVAAEGERLFAAVKLKAMGRVAATGAWQVGGARSHARQLHPPTAR